MPTTTKYNAIIRSVNWNSMPPIGCVSLAAKCHCPQCIMKMAPNEDGTQHDGDDEEAAEAGAECRE